MIKRPAWDSRRFLLIGLGMLLAACATQEDLRQVKEQTKRDLNIAQQRNAELETKVQEIKGEDLSAFQGQLETIRRDLDVMQSGLDDQKAQVFALNQKLSGKLEEQTVRLSGLEKRDEETGKNLAQATETIKEIGTKLSGQVDQQAVSLSKLEETTKQTDTQVKALAAQVAQFQEALGEFSKVLNSLNDRVAEVDRRSTELGGKTDGKTGAVATPESGQAAREMYDRARDEYKKGRYNAAVTAFQLLLTQYPRSVLVPSAHFWMAECYVKTRDFGRGIEEYEQVITRYPKSSKAATALYRKASVLLELNKKEAAKTALRQLIANYPESEDFQRARAKLASLK